MEFPLDLTKGFVYGTEELKQNIITLLKNPIGQFLQSMDLGAQYSIHSTSREEIEEGVRATLDQVLGIQVLDVKVVGYNVEASISYNGNTINFQYPISYD